MVVVFALCVHQRTRECEYMYLGLFLITEICLLAFSVFSTDCLVCFRLLQWVWTLFSIFQNLFFVSETLGIWHNPMDQRLSVLAQNACALSVLQEQEHLCSGWQRILLAQKENCNRLNLAHFHFSHCISLSELKRAGNIIGTNPRAPGQKEGKGKRLTGRKAEQNLQILMRSPVVSCCNREHSLPIGVGSSCRPSPRGNDDGSGCWRSRRRTWTRHRPNLKHSKETVLKSDWSTDPVLLGGWVSKPKILSANLGRIIFNFNTKQPIVFEHF